MKVAFVHDWLNGMRGGEKVLEALLELYPQADVFTLFYEPQKISEKIRSHRVIVSPLQKLPGAAAHYRNLLPLFPWAISRFDLSGYDLVISISHCVAKSARAVSSDRHLCYCLSPMRYLWSHFDQYQSARQTGLLSRMAMSVLGGPLRKWDRATSDRAGRYVAISNAIADRVRMAYGRDASVVYPPVDTDFFTPLGSSRKDYFLAVSAAVPYKRLDLAIEACNQLRLPLKVVGSGPGLAQLRAMAGPTVEVHGWVSDEELRELYRNCTALIFPPEEDFGIAPLEAQACGRPVIAFGKGGALETVSNGRTGVFFSQQTVESLVVALQNFDADAFDPTAIRSHALAFSRGRFLSEFEAEVERFLERPLKAVKSSAG